MAVLMGAVLLYLLARVATGDLSRSMAVWTGLAWARRAADQGACAGACRRSSWPPTWSARRARCANASAAPGVRRCWPEPSGAVVGGWWWVRNLIAYGAVQPNGLGPIYSKNQFGPDRPGGTDLKFLENFVRLFGKRVWGSLGLLDIPAMPTVIPVLIEVAFLALVAVGIAVGLRRSPAPRWAAVTFLLPVVVTLGVLYVGTRHWYLRHDEAAGRCRCATCSRCSPGSWCLPRSACGAWPGGCRGGCLRRWRCSRCCSNSRRPPSCSTSRCRRPSRVAGGGSWTGCTGCSAGRRGASPITEACSSRRRSSPSAALVVLVVLGARTPVPALVSPARAARRRRPAVDPDPR